MKIKKIVFAGMFLIAGLTVTSAQVKLSFNPDAGSNYEYRTEIVQNIKQSAMGREMPVEETVTMGFQMNVKSKNTQGVEAFFTYRDASYYLSSPMIKMGYDSKKSTENPNDLEKLLGKIFGGVVGKNFTLNVASDGKINTVSGVDAITGEIKKSVANDEVDKQTKLSDSEISQWLGEDALKGMFEQSFRIFPDKEVKIGDNWVIESSYGISNKKTKTKTVYILKSIADGIATVSSTATVEMEPSGGAEGTLNGGQAGEILVDVKTGIPVSSDLTLNIKGNVKMHQMDMQMEMAAKIKTTIK